MNVLYVLNSTYKLGGASKSFVTMVKGLGEKGIVPTVVLPDREGLYGDLAKMGVDVIVATYRPNTYPYRHSLKDYFLFLPRLLARRWVNHRAVAKLEQAARDRRIALVHTNVSVIDIGFRLSRKLCVPHIYHVREYGDLDFQGIYYPSWKSFHKTMSAPRSYAICVTDGILLHHGLRACANARVIYNGVAGFAPDKIEVEKEGCFLYVGRVEFAKGLDMLLEAYSAYWQKSSRKMPLWIAGDRKDDAYNRQLDEFIRTRGLGNHVRFLGGKKDVFALMRKANAIVVPSRREAFGRCMTEAMFNKCLVIGYDRGGTKEQFDNGLRFAGGEIGFRFSSVEELARILGRMDALSTDDCSEMIERAYRTVCAFYSVEAHVSKVYEFYCDILNEKVG